MASEHPRIIVVGGGISGLAAAHRLAELARGRAKPFEILLLEGSGRLGGVIATEKVDGFLVEAGPDSFVTEKPWALRLCERLGISSRLIPPEPGAQTIYVVHKGALAPLPEGFFLLAPTRFWPLARSPLFSWRGKLRMALELFLPRRRGSEDESLASFVRRRFGAEVLDRVAQPLIAGVYAADPERLSLSATMPRFSEIEKRSRSVILSMRFDRRSGSGARSAPFLAPAGGMEELVDAIAKELPGGTVRLASRVTALSRDAAKRRWTLTVNGRESLLAQGVVLAIPAHQAAGLLSSTAPEIAAELGAIPYSSTATVTLAYRSEDVSPKLKGSGFVVPAAESRKIVACTFSSLKYRGRAPEGHVLLRAFVGGALQAALFDQDEATMEASVRDELASLLGIRAEPLFSRTHRHPRSMPQYEVGHRERLRRIGACLAELPGLALAGNSYKGVGIPDCILSGEQAAEQLLESIGQSVDRSRAD